jgi:hypothetical protein
MLAGDPTTSSSSSPGAELLDASIDCEPLLLLLLLLPGLRSLLEYESMFFRGFDKEYGSFDLRRADALLDCAYGSVAVLLLLLDSCFLRLVPVLLFKLLFRVLLARVVVAAVSTTVAGVE